jgi:hypothetical protein
MPAATSDCSRRDAWLRRDSAIALHGPIAPSSATAASASGIACSVNARRRISHIVPPIASRVSVTSTTKRTTRNSVRPY